MKESPTAKTRRVYEEMAPRYDRAMAFAERCWFTGGRAWLGSRAVGEVLEVGIGTGASLPYYAPGVRVTGMDLSPAMLERARDRARDAGMSVELREGDAQALPFEECRFDAVVCALALCAIPDERAAIAEMHRVLRPGGNLLLLDHIASNWWPIWLLQRAVEVVSARTAGEHFTRRPLLLLEGLGFEVVESQRLRAGTVERVRARKL